MEANWGIINNEGEIIIDFKYKSIQNDKGYFILKSEYNQTIIDKDGKEILPVIYYSVHRQEKGIYQISYKCNTFTLNLEGQCLEIAQTKVF